MKTLVNVCQAVPCHAETGVFPEFMSNLHKSAQICTNLSNLSEGADNRHTTMFENMRNCNFFLTGGSCLKMQQLLDISKNCG